MRRKLHLSIFILLITSFYISAQSYQHQWHFSSGDTGTAYEETRFTHLDDQGNQYFAGSFSGTVDFDPGPATYNLSVVNGVTKSDAFVLKLDPQGNFLWAKRFGSNTNTDDYLTNMYVDQDKNVYLMGTYTGSITLNPGGTTWQGGSSNTDRPYLVKLDSLGNFQWGYGWKNTGSSDFLWGWDVVADTLGQVFMSGSFQGTINLDPKADSTWTYTSAGYQSGFLLRFSSSGVLQKSRLYQVSGSSNGLYAKSLAIDPNQNIYFGGQFSGNVDFDNGSGTYILSGGSGSEFIAKMDSDFNHIWAKKRGGIAGIYDLKLSIKGNIYISSSFQSTVDLDPTAGVFNVSSNGSMDISITKLDTSGNFLWGKAFGSNSLDYSNELAINDNEEVFSIGYFHSTVDFDPGPNTYSLTSYGGRDGYLLRLDSLGNFVSAIQIGGVSRDNMRGVHAISNDEVMVSGYFTGTIDVDPDTSNIVSVTTNGGKDFLMLRLKSCVPVAFAFADTVCGSYTVPSGTATYTQSGTYQDTVRSSMGCDSVLTIQVQIEPDLNPTITQNADTLTAIAIGVISYQWIDCSTNQAINGETDSIFTPTANGNYAVVVSNTNCRDTSACFSVNNISVDEHELFQKLAIYPNPTTGKLSLKNLPENTTVSLYTLNGQQFLAQETASQNTELDLQAYPSGLYLIRITTPSGASLFRKVVRE